MRSRQFTDRLKHIAGPKFITGFACILYIGGILSLSGGDPMVFVGLGTRFAEQNSQGTEGYDGQFVYYIATDPLKAPAKIDVPAYRFQRIIYPLLALILSGGYDALIPWLLLLINLLAITACVGLVETMLTWHHISRWYALPVGLYAGQLLSLRVDLPEPLALSLTLLGMWLFSHGQWLWSAIAFSLAVLTKETMLISGGAYFLYMLFRVPEFKELMSKWFTKNLAGNSFPNPPKEAGLNFPVWGAKEAISFGLILLLPFSLYQIGLYFWLGQIGLGSGGAGATSFSIIPFGGLWPVSEVGWDIFALFLLLLGPMILWPTLWAIFVTGHQLLFYAWHPWTVVLFFNALVIPFLPFSTFREPLAMLRFTVPLVAFTILYAAHFRQRRVLNYSLLWIMTLVFLLQDPLLYIQPN